MMRTYICFLLLKLILLANALHAQMQDSVISGKVSYVSSKNVYIKFNSTKGIKIGDTLSITKDGNRIPALVVFNKSSSSCVSTPILDIKFEIGMEIHFQHFFETIEERNKPEIVEEGPVYQTPVITEKVIKAETTERKQNKNVWTGRLSMASYSNFSPAIDKPTHRMQYSLSLNGNQIAGSKFSLESYISFRHKSGEWDLVKEDINNALKIYSFAMKYSFKNKLDVYAGRRINYKLSSMGAIDGLQLEKSIGKFSIGTVGGSRPDPFNYGFNINFLQVGGYAAYHLNVTNKFSSENTLAFIQQMNHGNTDRRFIHLQHTSTAFKNMSIFASMEFDLYEKLGENVSNTFRLTNLYMTLRYRFSRSFSVSGSYDARSDVIYYETYKNTLDSLLEYETRQGLRLQFNYQPFRFTSIGCSGNMRFRDSHGSESKNLNIYINYSKLPLIGAGINLTGNLLQTNYMKSQSYGINLTKDFFKSRFYGDIYFRFAKYEYLNFEYALDQKIAGINLSYRINKKLNLNAYAEKTFEKTNSYLRVNFRIMARI